MDATPIFAEMVRLMDELGILVYLQVIIAMSVGLAVLSWFTRGR